jgi:dihydrofolate reductase
VDQLDSDEGQCRRGRVPELKREPDKDILFFGSSNLVNALMQHNLIDEFRLMVFPKVLGSARRLFMDGIDEMVLEFLDTQTFGTVVHYLTYRPAGE